MVACPHNYYFIDYRVANYIWGEFSPCSFYIYIILMKYKKKHIETLLVICLFLVFLGRLYRSWNFLYVALGISVLGLLWKRFRELVHWWWMKLAEIMGYCTGKILLSIVFVLVVIPFSFLARLRGKISLRLKAGADTYFIQRNHQYLPKDFDHPW